MYKIRYLIDIEYTEERMYSMRDREEQALTERETRRRRRRSIPQENREEF